LTLIGTDRNHPSWACAKYDLVAVTKQPGYNLRLGKHPPGVHANERMAARWQTRVYRALLVEAGAHLNSGRPFEPEQIEMVYWYADYSSEPTRFKYDSDQFKRDWSSN